MSDSSTIAYAPQSIRVDGLLMAAGVVVVACLLLGGGTRPGFLSDAILQLTAVPLLILALWRWLDAPFDARTALPVAFCVSILLVPLVQVIPLPPSVWRALPHREAALETFDLIGRPLSYAPISVAPYMTSAAISSLIPSVAIFLGALYLEPRDRRSLALLLLPIGVLSVFIGVGQVFQGADSWLRFFKFTNPTEAVGFFANRNHLAALLYCLLPFAAAWLADSVAASGQDRVATASTSLINILAGVGAMAILIIGLAMTRSRAGMTLAFVSLLGSFALVSLDKRRMASSFSTSKIFAAAVVVAILLSVNFAFYRVLERFGADPLDDMRWSLAERTLEAGKAYFPFGSGFGTFPLVYGTFQRVDELFPNSFANRAHNDVLEVFMEGGVFGVAVIFLFLIWWARRTIQIWRKSDESPFQVDEPYAHAATLVVPLLVLHSFLDYPLRTGGIMAILAVACGLIAPSPPATRKAPAFSHAATRPGPAPRSRKRSSPQLTPWSAPEQKALPAPTPPPDIPAHMPRPSQAGGRIGLEDGDWPTEWRDK